MAWAGYKCRTVYNNLVDEIHTMRLTFFTFALVTCILSLVMENLCHTKSKSSFHDSQG